MASSSQASGGVVAAHLGFLAIFNPSLGNTDETVEDQIVYYASVSTQSASQKRRPRRTRGRPTDAVSQQERNERLRQIGLAQGIASFSRGFADGAPVDSIDTERSRVVMHELEPGWWMLASIDLTKVPLPPRLPVKAGQGPEERLFEYSTREMKPATLLLRDLLRAHSIFLMHHGSSLSALFVRCRRSQFVAILTRYWDLFLSTWSVVLHGNPARDVFGGINVAASGELGVGVGEEARGSGEREVLEGLVGRIEGLVDLVVSKFGSDQGDPARGSKDADKGQQQQQPWLGTGQEPAADDGAIFLGTGALSRKSLRDVTHWIEDLYTWGEHAYGVIESPTSVRRAKDRKATKSAERSSKPDTTGDETLGPGSSTQQTASQPRQAASKEKDDGVSSKEMEGTEDGKLDKMLNYLKLGYGSYWTFSGGSGDDSSVQTPNERPEPSSASRPSGPSRASSSEAAGHYLIGLRGEIEEGREGPDASQTSSDSDAEHNSRTVLRTIHVELESGAAGEQPEASVVKDFAHPTSAVTQSQVVGNMLPGYHSHDLNKADKLRVVVYVNRPFIFTFLFRLRTDSLAWDAMYRSLHYQLAPLKKPLLASTSYRPDRPGATANIYNLVWDPASVTVHSTIPNIPEHATTSDPWSRADAVNTHHHLLNIHSATRRPRSGDLERTHKTSRGWWLVWTRLLRRHSSSGGADDDDPLRNLSTIHESSSAASSSCGSRRQSRDGPDGHLPDMAKEIFLIRRASDHAGFRGTVSEGGGADGAGKLAQGIGVDTRRYVDELLLSLL